MSLIDSILQAGQGTSTADPNFPNAPDGWTVAAACQLASQDGLTVTEEHWEVVRALQEYFVKHPEPSIHVRALHDALHEKFYHKGGIKHLYRLLPGGPVAQGCRLAGLRPPAGAIDKGFGSVT